jgi:hypothetical protein
MLTKDRLRQLVIVWILSLVAISLQPYRPRGESRSIVHRALHIIAFGSTGLILLALGTGGKQEWTATLTVVCLAVAIESAQHLLYRGPFEWWDVRDDAIGLLLAVLVIRRTRIRDVLVRSG